MPDIAMTGNGDLTNLPDDGFPVSRTGKHQLVTGITVKDGEQIADTFRFEVHEDGSVTCDPGYEPVVEAGKITKFLELV